MPSTDMSGIAARDEAMARVLANAKREWRDRYYQLFDLLPDGFYMGEDINNFMRRRRLAEPHHPNAWSSMIGQLVRQKRLVDTGMRKRKKNTSSHASLSFVYRKGSDGLPPDEIDFAGHTYIRGDLVEDAD